MIRIGSVKTPPKPSPCDYCGESGHHWTTHPEAVADAAKWAKEVQREEFPFGDHRET